MITNMAEGESVSASAALVDGTNNIRAIVNNVVNHPQFRSLLTDVVESSKQTPESGNVRNNINLNQSTTRPSTNENHNVARTETSRNFGRSTYSGPLEEFNSIFRFGSTRAQRGGGTVASFNPIASTSGSPAGARSTPSRSRNRRRAQSQTALSSNPSTNCFSREVILLNAPNDCTTVRGKAKADLIKNGHVISSFDFNKTWSAEEIVRRISLAFKEKLQGSSFKIKIGVGSELVEPALMADQRLNGERLCRLFAQKTVWIIPNNSLLPKDQCTIFDSLPETSDENEDSDSCVNENGLEIVEVKELPSSQPSNKTNDESQLEAMFPGETPERIAKALEVGQDLFGAVDFLLCDDDSDLDEVWDMPLSTKVRGLDHLEALQDFIGNIAKPHLPELGLTVSRDKSVLQQVIRIYKNPHTNFGAPLNVQFISSGVLEHGIDAGAPTKNFVSQLMNEIGHSTFNGATLFEGEVGHLLPIPNYDLVSGHFYEMVGKMISHSIINKCKGVKGISPAVIKHILSGNRESVLGDVTVKDIPDPCLQQTLLELVECPDKDLGKYLDNSQDCYLGDLLMSSGFPDLQITASNKRMAYECILIHDVITKRVVVLDDLRKGLTAVTSLGTSLVNLANEYTFIRKLVFPDADGNIDLHELIRLIEYDYIDDVEKTSAKDNMNCYLDLLSKRGNSDERLEDLLQFWTGWPGLPSTNEKLKVSFLPTQANSVLAVADACFNSLKIPTCHTEFSDFVRYMDISVSHGKQAFGRM